MPFGASIIRPPTTITAVRLSNKRQKLLQLRPSISRSSNFASYFRHCKTSTTFTSFTAYTNKTTEVATISHAKNLH